MTQTLKNLTVSVLRSGRVDESDALADAQEVVGHEGDPLRLGNELVTHAEALLVTDQLVAES